MMAVTNWNQFLTGRTVASVDTSCVNVISITFTDGAKVDLEAVNAGSGILGVELRHSVRHAHE